ncbi:HpcH/HpaI aldolase/citrate lyase family protein [Auritidibacter ignavus]|uniref:HpcH/HpaI aldolase/citrate lyase family protein n=1 Tax=Auritidibacter ignavus TaxID=678932 RepID=UPI00109C6CF4|nr:CoA ester lyase [Auritidibacter ignavus]
MSDSGTSSILCPLFVPGDKPERFQKAMTSGADSVIFDLEDSIARAKKETARNNVKIYLSGSSNNIDIKTGVRINGIKSSHIVDDLRSLTSVIHRIDYLVLPMVESVNDIDYAISRLTRENANPSIPKIPVLALLETTQGILNAHQIATHKNVERLGLGVADLSAEVGLSEEEAPTLFDALRIKLVMASLATGITPPLDGPPLQIGDPDRALASTQHAKSCGMFGRICIHPSQVAPVKAVFTPSLNEIRRARKIWTAFSRAEMRGFAAIKLSDGTFVDYPVATRAKKVLQLANTFLSHG